VIGVSPTYKDLRLGWPGHWGFEDFTVRLDGHVSTDERGSSKTGSQPGADVGSDSEILEAEGFKDPGQLAPSIRLSGMSP
jgi:hypothetical protein